MHAYDYSTCTYQDHSTCMFYDACTIIIVHACNMIMIHVSCLARLMLDDVAGGGSGVPNAIYSIRLLLQRIRTKIRLSE